MADKGKDAKPKRGRSLVLTPLVVLALLALSVPLQYLAKEEVVVGLSAESGHSHAHGPGEDESSHAGEEGEAHTEEEGHAVSEATLGINLIPNYGFEVGTREGAWGWSPGPHAEGVLIYRDDSVSYKGLASAAVSTGGIMAADAGWFMRLDEPPLEHDVVFEGYVKTEGMQGAAFLRVLFETGDGEQESKLFWADSEGVSGNADWTLQSTRCFIPGEASGVWVEVGVSGSGRAWFDDLSLVARENGEE